MRSMLEEERQGHQRFCGMSPLPIHHEYKLADYSFSHNHGSGKRLYLKGNYYWRDPFLTSMTMGGRVCQIKRVGWMAVEDYFWQDLFFQ